MKRLILFSLVICMFAFLSAGKIQVQGKIWPYYEYVLAPDVADDYNKFDIGRAYFGVKGDLSENIGARLTQEIKRMSDGYLHVYLKYCYLELKGFVPGLKVQLGQAGMPWVGFEEKLWGFRYVQKVMPDLAGKLSSTGLGLIAIYKFPGGYGEFHGAGVNGTGYHAVENNKHKDVHGRLTIVPMPTSDVMKGLKISGFGSYGIVTEDVTTTRLLGNLFYAYDFLSLGGTFLAATDESQDTLGTITETSSQGYSAYCLINFCKLMQKKHNGGIFVRYDNFDPDTDVADNGWTKIIGGVWVQIIKGSQISVDLQQKSYDAAGAEDEREIYLHTEVKFTIPG